ncbi:hypothetical protein NDU88_001185 [Pleurodeles waltl]|uniref:Uncharacterized protein n=1 Tax=Pleurodeles waltl TaxID=8319 RepID=A0AAV7P362_PLEWA|nr:hypothetical protein NDU88_001185 [Pleurodeles waltl]
MDVTGTLHQPARDGTGRDELLSLGVHDAMFLKHCEPVLTEAAPAGMNKAASKNTGRLVAAPGAETCAVSASHVT